MKKLLFIFSLLTFSFSVFAANFTQGDISIKAPWARMGDSSNDTAVGFMVLVNNGGIDDALESASSPRAGRAILKNANWQNTDEISLETRSTVELYPKGAYIEFINVTQPLKLGEHFPVTLNFKRAGSITIQVEVRDSVEMPAFIVNPN